MFCFSRYDSLIPDREVSYYLLLGLYILFNFCSVVNLLLTNMQLDKQEMSYFWITYNELLNIIQLYYTLYILIKESKGDIFHLTTFDNYDFTLFKVARALSLIWFFSYIKIIQETDESLKEPVVYIIAINFVGNIFNLLV